MEVVSRGRGNNKGYGDVSELNPEDYTAEQMNIISLGRGREYYEK